MEEAEWLNGNTMTLVLFSDLWLNKMNEWNLMLLSSSEFGRRKMTVKLSNEHVQWHVIEITKTKQSKVDWRDWRHSAEYGVGGCKGIVPHSGHVSAKELRIFLYDGEDWSKFQSSSNLWSNEALALFIIYILNYLKVHWWGNSYISPFHSFEKC